LTQDPIDPGLDLARLKKKQGKKNSVDPARPGQKLGCNSLIFVLFFLLKRRRFEFFFKN
jgi:hypothetical protein